MKRLFIAATGQDHGKTTLSLGLLSALARRGLKCGFLKPVGQRYKTVDDLFVDEDCLLLTEALGLTEDLADISPVAVRRSFTREYLDNPDVKPLEDRILSSFERVAAGKDVVVVEGTGHSGVGSIFDLSNARVAQLLEAKVMVVALGGIGRPVDELCLNACLYRARGVEVLGSVFNKVLPKKMDQVRHYNSLALKREKMRLYGSIPLQPRMAAPTMAQIVDEFGGEVLHVGSGMTQVVDHVIVGAMSASNALPYLKRHTLLITGGDRDDLILAAISKWAQNGDEKTPGSIILTGGIAPHENVLEALRRSPIATVLMKDDSYRVASRVNRLSVKIQPADEEKIVLARELIQQYVDVDGILENL